MSVLIFIVTILLAQGDSLVKQNDVSVYLYDLDVYVHGLSPDKRYGFASDPGQIEKNIVTILNMNFVYDYIIKNDIDENEGFKTGKKTVEELELEPDLDFVNKLGIDQNEFNKNLRLFLLKREYFARMRYWLMSEAYENNAESLAHDYFIANKNSYTVPEKRKIQMITLDKAEVTLNQSTEYLETLINGSDFSELANKVSSDITVNLNGGDLGYFSKEQFKYPFKNDVFAAELGVVPNIFSYKENMYLISIAEIIEHKPGDYNEHKENIQNEIITKIVQQKIQGIIDSYSIADKIKVNTSAINAIMERYLVFEVDRK